MTSRTMHVPPTPPSAPASEDFGRPWTSSSQIYGELQKLTGCMPSYTIRRLLELAASGRAGPMIQRDGRWGTYDVPGVAAALGLTVGSGNAPARRSSARDHSLVAA